MATGRSATCLIAAALLLGGAGASHADPVADFYKGKQLRFIIGSGVGGGYDFFARLLARHMPRYIPGNPAIIVQHQPAAGGIVMTNQLYSQGPNDGTAVGAPLNGVPTAPLLQSGAQFDATKLIWLGSANREPYVAFAWHTSPVTRIEDVRDRELVVGSSTPGSTTSDFPLLLNEILGYRFRVVRGYQSMAAINIAIERGEIAGNAGIGWATVKALNQKWLDDGQIRLLLQYGLKRHHDLADVPLVMELANSEPDRQAMRLLFARTEYSRPYFLPPGVPADRVAALRRAFDAAMNDPALLAEAAKAQVEVSPMPGEAMQALVGDLARTPPDVVRRVRAALEK